MNNDYDSPFVLEGWIKLSEVNLVCGRYQLSLFGEDIDQFFDTSALDPLDFSPRYNIAPTQYAPVVRRQVAARSISLLRWGLVPHWAQNPDGAARLINARSETVAEKPSFRDSFQRMRCLVPSTGFYEWKRTGKEKIPHLIQVRGQTVYAMAGIWSRWMGPSGPLDTFSVLTTGAAESIADVHERMPVILHPDHYSSWLDPAAPRDYLLGLCQPLPDRFIERRVVADFVNSARNEGPACEAPGLVQTSLIE